MPSSTSNPDGQGGLWILEINLKSIKPFKSAMLKIETPSDSKMYREETKAGSIQVTFAGFRNIPVTAGSTLQIECRYSVISKKTIRIKGAEILGVHRQDGSAWTKTYGSAEITIQLENHSGDVPRSSLDSNGQLHLTTDEIRKTCPRFRILVLGKSGAGKSSLINSIFGVTDAFVSHDRPGEANIEKEILSKSNPWFVLHDSQGFEGGESGTFVVVQEFIKRRGKMSEIKEKLHAVWVCIEIPTSEGRLMETGVENFLQLAAGGHLGKVPVIVIFTKYDALVTTEQMVMVNAELEATTERAEERADARIDKDCIIPLKAFVGDNIPFVVVSTDSLYRNTFTKLIDVTYDKVSGYIMEAGVLTGISQKINPGVKILTSIEVGKRNYWRGLVSETLPGMTMENFLAVIHIDIVKVWDLEDKGNYLTCAEFKQLMLQTVQEAESRDSNETVMMGAKTTGATTTIARLFVRPAMLIALPITATIAAAAWIHDINRQTHENLRRMMTYIVSLTIVMQNLFWMQSALASKSKSGDDVDGTPNRLFVPITKGLIIQALSLYLYAADREELLSQIRDYAERVNFITQRPDAAVEKITHLLHSSTISSEDAFKQQRELGELDKSWEDEGDGSWPSFISTSAM